ncbi:TPA: hypothetical protein ACHY66_001785, partial [Escherichia coli]
RYQMKCKSVSKKSPRYTNKLAPYDVQLEAGQIILGGSFTRPVPARKGDTFHVDYGNMGSISCRFV